MSEDKVDTEQIGVIKIPDTADLSQEECRRLALSFYSRSKATIMSIQQRRSI